MAGPNDYFDAPQDKRMALAIAKGDTATVEQLLDSEAVDPQKVGRDATSWLIVAIAAAQKESLETLLRHDALGNPNGPIAGQALYSATLLDDLYWLKRLHKAGANLNNYGGGDLLLVAAMNTRNEETLDFYLQHKADLNMPTNLKGSVALSAARVQRFDLVNKFLDLNASPWVMDSLGSTLGYAAEKVAKLPSWNRESEMERERLLLLARLHAIGFPQPAPTPDQGDQLRKAHRWPPAKAPKTAPRPRGR